MSEDTKLNCLIKEAKAAVAAMSPAEIAIMCAEQQRSWVIGEMMLADETLTRDEALRRYSLTTNGALLAEIDRLKANQKPAKEPEHVAEDGTVRKDHYGSGRQPWDDIVLKGWGPAFAAGNVLKYIRRHTMKNGKNDLEKARWYFQALMDDKTVTDESDSSYSEVPDAIFTLSDLLTSEEWGLLQ